MGLLSKLVRRGPPDIVDLHLHDDVEGLERALAYESPEIVKAAAGAILALHAHGDAVTSRRAGATGEALMAALARMQAAGAGDTAYASWSLIDALGEIRETRAVPPLVDLVRDSTADEYQRLHAAEALGKIGDPVAVGPLSRLLHEPRIDRRAYISATLDELGGAAAVALARLGEEGVIALKAEALAGGPSGENALRGLREAAHGGGAGQSLAMQTVAAIEAERAEAARSEREREEAAKHSALQQRLAAHPAAARLAAALGHEEWVTDSGSLRPHTADAYRDALDRCRAMALKVDEHEDVVDNEMSDVWATVEWEGGTLTIDGGRQFRDVLY